MENQQTTKIKTKTKKLYDTPENLAPDRKLPAEPKQADGVTLQVHYDDEETPKKTDKDVKFSDTTPHPLAPFEDPNLTEDTYPEATPMKEDMTDPVEYRRKITALAIVSLFLIAAIVVLVAIM